MVGNMKLTKEQVQKDLDALPEHYKTGDVDRLIRQYVKQKADVSALRPYILDQQQFHRIYFYVTLNQIRNADERMAFIHENLLFSDWWHTDQLISYVADLDFDVALLYAKNYHPFGRSLHPPLGVCVVYLPAVQGARRAAFASCAQ